jgi:hypothetical protein
LKLLSRDLDFFEQYLKRRANLADVRFSLPSGSSVRSRSRTQRLEIPIDYFWHIACGYHDS